MTFRLPRTAPKPLRRTSNGALAALLTLMLSGPPAQATADPFDLPEMGSSADMVMSVSDQRALAQEFMKWVRKTLKVSDDPMLTDYLQTLGSQLVSASREGSAHYNFFLVDDPSVNAFAGPSGNIGVNAGLILAAETEAELAAVLAHEIAHVSQ